MRSSVHRRTRLDSWQRVEVENEARFRDLNEWTCAAHDDADVEHIWEVYLCECGDASCSDPVTLTRAEYEIVRAEGTHFVLAANHENPELDLVVVEYDRYTIVQKRFGEAARIAYARDPRR